MPSDDVLQGYYLEHMDSISTAESRKVQMVVVASKEEAESIKAQIDGGEITMYQAAQRFSLDPIRVFVFYLGCKFPFLFSTFFILGFILNLF